MCQGKKDEEPVWRVHNVLKRFAWRDFKGNENYKKIIETSVFCSEDNNIISEDYKITKDQKIGIIPPIGGG